MFEYGLRVEFDGNLFEKECVFTHSFLYSNFQKYFYLKEKAILFVIKY